jgi:hypothetical protein
MNHNLVVIPLIGHKDYYLEEFHLMQYLISLLYLKENMKLIHWQLS